MTQVCHDLKKFAAVSVVLCILFYTIICLGFNVPPKLMPFKLGLIISMVGFYWIFFEKWGWKFQIFRLWGWLCDIPDLNGRWEGIVDRIGEDDPHTFAVEIRQTFTKIQLHTFSKNSTGYSICGQFVTDHVQGRYSLISTWHCRTRSRSVKGDFDEFNGTSIFDIFEKEDGRYLEDFYFTRRAVQTKGITKLKFVGEKLKNGI